LGRVLESHIMGERNDIMGDRNDLGRRVAAARERAGVTQEELARHLDLDRTAVAKIEAGRRRVSALELAGVADALGYPMEWFIRGGGPGTMAELKSRRRQILAIARKHGAGNVRVFGSVARGEADAASDIDLLVDMEAGRSLLDLAGLKLDLEGLLARPVDVGTKLRERISAEVIPL
jgi:uncharacterized protein